MNWDEAGAAADKLETSPALVTSGLNNHIFQDSKEQERNV